MIKLVNVSKYYSSNGVIALGLRKVNLELYRNEFVAIVGESGSGKTTLLNVISGIDSYEDGEMYINDKETSYFSVDDMENYRKKYVAFVFQNYNLIDSYTVLQNVEAPLILSGYPKDKIRDRAKEISRRVGLEDHSHHKATRLSGGQKQRVVIARALAKDCPIIAADEPTGNLDSESARQIIELLNEISKEKLVIVVTHDFSQVEEFATRKIRIFDGEVVEDLKVKKVDKLEMPVISDEDYRIRFIDYMKISLKNMLAVPKKTLLMIVIFSFFSFFVALSYGAYQLAMSETTYNQNSHFSNTSPNRIVIRKMDGSELTTDDIAELEDYDLVEQVIPFDYILDSQAYIYSETVNDYSYLYGLFLPQSLLEEDDLDYGRLSTRDDEVVVAVNQYELNNYEDYLNKTFYSGYYFYEGQQRGSNAFKVVGMIDVDKLPITNESFDDAFLMLTDSRLEEIRKTYYFNFASRALVTGFVEEDGTRVITEYIGGVDYVIDNTVPDDTVRVSNQRYYGECESAQCLLEGTLNIDDYYINTEVEDFTVIYDSSILNYNEYRLNQATYDLIFYDEIYQVSILTNKDIGVSSLVRTLQRLTDGPLSLKYKVVYPFDSNASNDFEALILLMMSIGLIGLIIVTLIGSTLITYVIFRAIINTKLHDYAIFRTIGANKKVIKSFIYLENLYVVVVSYILFLILSLSLPLGLVQNTILHLLKVFTVWNYIIFFFLLVIMSLIISRKYNNRIFRQSVQKTLKTELG